MPIRFAAGAAPRAIFEGPCIAEEADALLDWLRQQPAPVAELAGCTLLHSALAQLLMVAPAQLATPPADALLAAALGLAGLPPAVTTTVPTASPRASRRRRPRPGAGTATTQVTP